MKCPGCQAECAEQAEACFTCGKALFALTGGTLLGGRYEIVRPVGRGGMSRVYQARDRVLGEAVAIKVLRAELAWEPEMRRRFLHEIRLARRVSHPNVCRIHEYGEDGARRFISMELVEGVNLKDVLRSRGLTTEEAFDLALQMADGLAAVHQHGIVHRDFKASNIMVARNGMAKLMDFGIAKHAEGDTGNFTTPGQVLGTPEYMSPEHARGGKVDFRSDVYALGCVVFEIFTGQAPFRGANAFATISKHFYEAPPLEGPLAALIPEPLVPVLRKALSKDPAGRYASVPQAREALRRAQAESVPHVLGEPREDNEAGSARLRALCEALLAEDAGALAPGGPDSSAEDLTPSPLVHAVPPGLTRRAEGPRPAPIRTRRRNGRAVLLGAAAAALIAAASSLALWRDAGIPSASAPRALPEASAPGPSPTAAALRPAESPSPEGEQSSRASSARAPLVAAPTPPSFLPVAARPAPAVPPTESSTSPAPERVQAPAATGTLRLLVVPWAEVIIDGTSVGTVSFREIPLPPGAHAVRMLHPDFQPLQRKVTIEAAREERLVVDLSEQGIRRAP